jgi:alpha-L-fucosidase 2
VNGDQSGKGYSNFVYRPFTLEGNFAYAAGIQEMLMQSHTGVIRLFPAIPDSWKDVTFHQLRAAGAFQVSARMEEGKVRTIEIESEQEGEMRLLNPFGNEAFEVDGIHRDRIHFEGDELVVHTVPGEHFSFYLNSHEAH